MRVLAVIGLVVSASCSYGVSFEDCQVGCAASGPCPDGFTCGAEALCRAEGATGTCAAMGGGDAGATRVPGIYAVDFGENAILVFALDATGSATPVRTISGPDTQLNAPDGIAIDHAGNIFVANLGADTVTVYPGDADGNAAPSRVIDVHRPEAIAIGSGDDVFIATAGATTTTEVFHVPPGAATSDRSFLPIGSEGHEPYLALDEAGDVIFAIDESVATYAATATGSATPLRSFSLPVGEDITPAVAFIGGAIAVTKDTGEILVFDEQTTGAATPTSTLAPAEIVHVEQGLSLAVDGSSGSPVFYVGDAQLPTLFEVPATGTGANLTAGAVRSISLASGVQLFGIAVVP